jgi:hypothetical protein
MLLPPQAPGTGQSLASLGPAHDALIKQRLDRETDLIFQRTAWVVGSQAFLFSAYAISLNGPRHGATPELEAKSRLLVVLIPWVSLASLCLLLVTILAGSVAWLRLHAHESRSDSALRSLEGGPILRMAGLAAPLLIPVAFIATWVVLLVGG